MYLLFRLSLFGQEHKMHQNCYASFLLMPRLGITPPAYQLTKTKF